MTLRLPEPANLTPEQRSVLSLPFDESYLITGGPGTGKTVTAIYRTAALHHSGRPVVMLMYSRVLSAHTQAAVASVGVGDIVTTYHKWFHGLWRACYGRNPPTLDRYQIDWIACLKQILTIPPPTAEKPYVVVDEGQDMPKEFYLFLRAFSTAVTVFADENQRINAQQSTIPEIIAAGNLKNTVALPRDNRSTRSISNLAARFHPAGVGAICTDDLVDGAMPDLVRTDQRADAVEYIRLHEKEHPFDTIGVLLHRSRDIFSYYHRLDGTTTNPVQGYVSGRKNDSLADPTFTGPGIKLISWQSAKGLEFDSVFLPELQSFAGDPTLDDVRLQIYVLITRARRALTFMYTGHGEPAIVAALPKHLLAGDFSASAGPGGAEQAR